MGHRKSMLPRAVSILVEKATRNSVPFLAGRWDSKFLLGVSTRANHNHLSTFESRNSERPSAMSRRPEKWIGSLVLAAFLEPTA